MKNFYKTTPFALAALLAGGLLLPPAIAQADKKIVINKAGRHHQDNKVIIIKKPAKRHRKNGHRGRAVKAAPRRRHFRGTRVWRPHGHPYFGYGFFHSDDDAYKWLAFTSITLKILDNFNEDQQRLHEAAQVRATTAEVGETIIWEEGDRKGSVKTTRIGTSTAGRQCREFQQTVTIGNRTEQAYGVACLQPDGSWELVQ